MLTRRPILVLIVAIALAAFVTLITALVMQQMRRDALAQARAAAYNIALLFERDTERNLELYDLSLQAVIDGLDDPRVAALPMEIRQSVLFDRAAMTKNLGVLLVADAAGDVYYDSRRHTQRHLNIADCDYFAAQHTSPHTGLFVSHPFIPGNGPTEMSIAMSRRLSNPDGSFAGAVVVTMRLEYFRQLFSGVDIGTDGVLVITLADGTLLMRRPYDPKLVGTSVQGAPVFQRIDHEDSGGFFANGQVDGIRRWYAFRRVQGFPLVFSVGLSTREIYREWRLRAWFIGALTAVLDISLIGAGVLLARQLRQRAALEAELRAQAGTDALTSLANRRAFEARASNEWLRVRRTGSPLAMLMFDIDRFKLYNDRYGHHAGDGALAAVAHVVNDYARRAGDCAARFGGEEFVLMLPNTDEAGARAVGEQVRAAVEALAIRHEDAANGVLTVSVGVASTSAGTFVSWGDLNEAADAALYAAKRAGRNRVVAWQPGFAGAT
ncbi:diguanylate cyclase [Paraburkholderia sp.]|uniref:sensor domain-containing diguanylate cyclase n=1 Tax=Paraburkholderia sp. TaxID=1926495 RepID=UPI0025DDD373|nr:diguanylate cyclase [Paraburkholderia sp.]